MVVHQPTNSLGNYNYNAFTYTNISYGPHFHKNMELIYVLEGNLQVTVNGVLKVVESGKMVLVLSNQIHSFEPYPESIIWVAVFSEEYVPRFAGSVKGKQGKTFDFSPSDSVREMVRQHLIAEEGSLYMKKACFYAVCDCYCNNTQMESRFAKADFVIGNLLDWVSEHYTENISLKKLSQDFGYEYHYFSRLLRQQYAISFNKLVNSYRLEAAKHMLESSEFNITDIAIESGFQNIRSFNHIFKEYMGVTPKQYREQLPVRTNISSVKSLVDEK